MPRVFAITVMWALSTVPTSVLAADVPTPEPLSWTYIVVALAGTFTMSFIVYWRDADRIRSTGPDGIRTYFISQVLIAPFSLIFVISIASFVGSGILTALLLGMVIPGILTKIPEVGGFERKRAAELTNSLSRAEAEIERTPDKTRPVWDLSRVQLELYITRNLAQVRNIFWITVAVMTAGFCMVIYGVSRAFATSLEVAILSSAAGIITQTIGATFLLIYRSTMNQAKEYVGTLERINAVGMAVQIVDLIPDEHEALKNKARADLVKQILTLSKK